MMSRQYLPLLGLLWSLPVFAEFNPRLVALNCLSCHQDRAGSGQSIPVLTGLSAQRIRQELLDFKYDRKAATLMPRLAKGFSDDELRLVADSINQQ